VGRVGDFGKSVRDFYLEHGVLPKLDLALLRTCPFYEQRLWCKHSMTPPGPEIKRYLDLLLREIRERVS
jgi:hypothetical protein